MGERYLIDRIGGVENVKRCQEERVAGFATGETQVPSEEATEKAQMV